jgi:hypothetical protein
VESSVEQVSFSPLATTALTSSPFSFIANGRSQSSSNSLGSFCLRRLCLRMQTYPERLNFIPTCRWNSCRNMERLRARALQGRCAKKRKGPCVPAKVEKAAE